MNRIVYTSRSLALLAGLVIFGGVAVAPAMAASITYSFNGTINANGVGNQVTPATLFTPPSTMSGFIKVNMADNDGNGNRGNYTIENFQVTFGGGYTASFGSSSSGSLEIRNGNGGGPNADQFNVTVNSPTGDTVNFNVPRLFTIALGGQNGIFSSDGLPNPAPSIGSSIGSFNGNNAFRIQFGSGNANNRAVQGVLTSLTAVPLPAGVVLFGVGLFALIGLGAGGLRNLRLPQA